MDLYARVNILNGRAVRLPRGDVATAISLEADPVARAEGWVEKGADKLLIIDLDAAAFGNYGNRPLIKQLIGAVDVPVIVGGGVRSTREVESLLDAGADQGRRALSLVPDLQVCVVRADQVVQTVPESLRRRVAKRRGRYPAEDPVAAPLQFLHVGAFNFEGGSHMSGLVLGPIGEGLLNGGGEMTPPLQADAEDSSRRNFLPAR